MAGLSAFISPLTSPPQVWLTPTGCFFKLTTGLVCVYSKRARAHRSTKQDYCCASGNDGLSRSWRSKLRRSVLWLSGRWDGCRGSGSFSWSSEEGTLGVPLLVFRKRVDSCSESTRSQIGDSWDLDKARWTLNFQKACVDFGSSLTARASQATQSKTH